MGQPTAGSDPTNPSAAAGRAPPPIAPMRSAGTAADQRSRTVVAVASPWVASAARDSCSIPGRCMTTPLSDTWLLPDRAFRDPVEDANHAPAMARPGPGGTARASRVVHRNRPFCSSWSLHNQWVASRRMVVMQNAPAGRPARRGGGRSTRVHRFSRTLAVVAGVPSLPRSATSPIPPVCMRGYPSPIEHAAPTSNDPADGV